MGDQFQAVLQVDEFPRPLGAGPGHHAGNPLLDGYAGLISQQFFRLFVGAIGQLHFQRAVRQVAGQEVLGAASYVLSMYFE